MKTPIYFDYAATTPVDPRVAQKMSECLLAEGKFGNPASRSHKFGWEAEEAVEIARRQVADLVNCDPREVVWTSGATESDNLAIKGVAHFYESKGRHIITSSIEHKAVLDTCRHLERKGFEVTYQEPGSDGLISPESVAQAIREDTTIVSIMHVNNEIGVVNDIAAIGEVCRENKVFFHVDAAQSAGKIDIDLQELKVDLMSFPPTRSMARRASALCSFDVSPGFAWKPRCTVAVMSAACGRAHSPLTSLSVWAKPFVSPGRKCTKRANVSWH